MKLLNIVLLAIAGTAAAQADMADMTMAADKKDGKPMSTKAMCNKMFKLEGLEKIAGNQTLLNEITKNNATKADDIKDKAKKAEPELKALQDNSTLVAECGKYAAYRKEKRQCGEMHRLERLEKIAGNDTLLNQVTKNNATKADDLKKKAQERKATLETLQKNTTLTAFCAEQKDKQTCRSMKGMQKMVDNSKNQTFLDTKFKGNQTKIDEYKKKATKTEERLKTLESNSTLMDICKKQTQGGSGGGRTSSPSNGGTSIQAFGVSTSILALFAAGLVLL
ncbi:hypothetical protein MCOR02_007075 [Pyricularia oryzae]|uniref:Uncharacterized protein n=4 Tax=Pyricularia TaxID=48558 RepID=G4NHB0_PYRO7|nr:uncharacterized protein MGG_03891 [Pyricularia oryzae 70-15]ELQ39714.1 hypothetical protein OOU_Y34scaffold00487g59 [Pyricularia oryzae Y34]KAH8846116.1 hypothetical protein MCOR01_003325 [Pyricularia oryzae]EHA47620.1 hypothetical protein MGG_03891 [Pyricularia oryzae 70-15]KAH9432374.1 hypothetical protein MCOR02_007075 [Pyricularia oryzae]KAI6260137.1 hypothetical protein MCOR19_003553 [Pyricularia oryzae]